MNFTIVLFKKWLKNDTEMHSIHNEGKSVFAGTFIRKLKTNIYKYMTIISKNQHIDKLTGIVNEYNNTYHRTIKMKPVDVKIIHTLILKKKLMIKILNLKFVIG